MILLLSIQYIIIYGSWYNDAQLPIGHARFSIDKLTSRKIIINELFLG